MNDSSNISGGGKLHHLQFLRFIAFCFIFCLHSASWTNRWFNVVNLGACSVSFFFILSGFVTGYSSHNKSIEFSWKNWGKDMLKKLKKLYPLYFIVTMIALYYYGGISQAVIYSDYGQIHSILGQLIKNILLIQTWFPSGYFSIYEISWFVPTIMFLYLLNLPIQYIGSKILRKKNGYLLITGIAIVILITTLSYCYITRELNIEFWQYVFPPSRMGEYLLGICLGYLYFPISNLLSKIGNNVYFFTLAEILAMATWFIVVTRLPTYVWGYRIAFWIIPNLMIIAVFMCGKGYVSKLFTLKPFVSLGNASFELYLIHLLVIREYVVNNGANAISSYANMVNFLMCIAITIIIGLYIHKKTSK